MLVTICLLPQHFKRLHFQEQQSLDNRMKLNETLAWKKRKLSGDGNYTFCWTSSCTSYLIPAGEKQEQMTQKKSGEHSAAVHTGMTSSPASSCNWQSLISVGLERAIYSLLISLMASLTERGLRSSCAIFRDTDHSAVYFEFCWVWITVRLPLRISREPHTSPQRHQLYCQLNPHATSCSFRKKICHFISRVMHKRNHNVLYFFVADMDDIVSVWTGADSLGTTERNNSTSQVTRMLM